jgi:4-amino-4-deoxychorismate lyase
MEPKWLVNGRDTGVPPSDRGLAYSDGLFETMAMDGGEIRWLDAHLERLHSGCSRLGIPCPDAPLLLAELGQLAPRTGRCVAKFIVTRGSSARGYRPPDDPTPTRIVGVTAWPNYPSERYRDGISLGVCHTPIGESPALAGLKHLGRLEQVLAQAELKSTRHVEGLMSTDAGHVIGGTMSNLFCVEDGVLRTPRLDRAGVRGIMRAIVMQRAAAAGVPVEETDLTITRVTGADEVFVTNAVFGIWPVRKIGAKKLFVGELCRRLMLEIGLGESN